MVVQPHYEDGEKLVHKIVCGPFDNNVYVLVCRKSGRGILIDASAGPDALRRYISGVDLSAAVITHGHRDHVAGVEQLRMSLGLEIGIHEADADSVPGGPDFFVNDGMAIRVGKLELRAIHTPGHTQGSTCYYVEPVLFSGDTLFPGGPGNTWGNPEAFQTIIASIERSLFALPDETLVMPGHGLDTTVGTERPQLQAWKERGW